nr:hypothetical protein [Tanacetum cinerariifolium]
MLDPKAYKEYYDVASGAEPPKAKTKYKKKADEPVTSSKSKTAPTSKGSRLKSSAKVAKTTKGLTVLSEVALSEAEKIKLATKRSKKDFHMSHASDSDSKAYKEYYDVASGAEPPKSKTKYKKKADEPVTSSKSKTAPTSKGSRLKSSAKRSKKDFHMSHASDSGDGVNIQSKVPDEQLQKVTGTYKGDGVRPEVPDVPKYASESDEESWTFSQDEDDVDEETNMNDDSEETESDNDGDDLTHPNLSTYKAGHEEEEDEKADDDEVSSDHKMYTLPGHQLTNEEENQEGNDEVKEVQHQSSSVSSDLVSKLINTSSDTSIDSILSPNIQSETLVNVPVSAVAESPSSDTTISQPLIPIIQPIQQTPESTTTITISTTTLPDIPNFTFLFQLINGIVDNYLASKMKEAVEVAVQLYTNKLREEAQAENQEFLNHVDSTLKTIIKEQVQAQVSKIMPKIKKYVTESLGAEVLILIDKMVENQSVNRSDIQKNLYNELVESYNSNKDIFSSYGDVVTLKRGRNDQDRDEDPFAGSNRGSKRRRSGKEAESSKEPTQQFFKKCIQISTKVFKQACSCRGACHLEEIIVRIHDDQLYKFSEDNFKRLRRQDIKDMLLLLVQNELSNLNLEEQRMTPYTAYPDIQGIIYEDEMNINLLMCTDELHKFSDVTLNHVRTAVNDIATGIEMDYLPTRKWSKQDKQRACVMIK